MTPEIVDATCGFIVNLIEAETPQADVVAEVRAIIVGWRALNRPGAFTQAIRRFQHNMTNTADEVEALMPKVRELERTGLTVTFGVGDVPPVTATYPVPGCVPMVRRAIDTYLAVANVLEAECPRVPQSLDALIAAL